ncbi:MAG: bifunctional transaldolase/phosoglucose isomerase [Chloroflexota bacterium]|nr:bifunctional transaldolase/phosoglucose isomerase [Chloroflexota bacterium]MBI5702817.1 bifunctional transaldolase/phosoglucose isomerase [Chloroflexota bacterium]
MNPIQKLTSLGQSLWYDNIQRRLLENGELQAMIERGEIRGVTSNPTIFNNAIAKTNDYDSALTPLAWAGWDAEKIFWQLAIEDIKAACDAFQPLYEETNGGDGYVSLEVSPYLAHDTDATIAQAQQLWARVRRPNLMVKIPATKEGVPAIRKAIAAGVNVNVTLIFSLARYAEVMNAYLSGLEDRLAAGHPVDHIASVASFFVSRVDSKIDPKLPEGSPLRGKAAIANAKLAYDLYQQTFAGRRWENLKVKGARVQRPLWASTSTKNPAYPDTIYVDNLIGPETVNTVPPQTLEAFKDHGIAEVTLVRGLDEARDAIAQLEALGISMEVVTQELEDEGVKAFADAFTQLLATIDERRKAAASSLGPLADSVSKRIAQLEADSVPARLWKHDPSLWVSDKDLEGQREVTIRMGWLDSTDKARKKLKEYQAFAKEIKKAKIDRVLVLGMGGSSLTAEVFSLLFEHEPQAIDRESSTINRSSSLKVGILDSTDPAQVAEAAQNFPPEKSLYIVASKSGGTAEVMAAFEYFWKLSKRDGARFAAITDPGTSLEALARKRGFRKIFTADPMVGGRYSALTDFGLVPAALLGMDLNRLLDRADWMRNQCSENCPAARDPGLALGAVLGEAALDGRDKLTVLADAPVSPFANWIEQIIAESSGKNGKGILPVPLEPIGNPEVYGDDRIFVYLRQTGEHEEVVAKLKAAGHPVIHFPLSTFYDIGAEIYRWEIATAIACHILGVNAFDQPNVESSKKITKAKIAEYQKKGKLREGKPAWKKDGVMVFSPTAVTGASLKAVLNGFLKKAKKGGYVAINAYLPRSAENTDVLQQMRAAIRAKTGNAVTAGFGPRFQHSTGQFHKGGPKNALFLVITAEPEKDFAIPNQGLTFGTLIRAQALGDYEALIEAKRKVMRVHLPSVKAITELLKALE